MDRYGPRFLIAGSAVVLGISLMLLPRRSQGGRMSLEIAGLITL